MMSFALLATLLLSLQLSCNAFIVYVTPNAVDSNADGTIAKPFTLNGAKRYLHGRAAGATVVLRGGDYLLTEPFVLEAADGGAHGRPVVYQAYVGENPRLLGGLEIPASAFHASHRPGVVVADLPSLGITDASMLGGVNASISELRAELFAESGGHFVPRAFAQDPEPLANGSWIWHGFNNIKMNDHPPGKPTPWFTFNDTAAVERGRWVEIAASSHGLWFFSHWGLYSGVQAHRVASINPIAGRAAGRGVVTSYNITMDMPTTRYTPGTTRFVAIDDLHFLDKPGEYWIDRAALKLYYYPVGSDGERLFLSVAPPLAVALDSPIRGLLEISATSDITISGLTIALSPMALLVADDVMRVDVNRCTFEGAGDVCVRLNGTDSVLRDSRVAQCGASALVLRGGNWNTYGPTLFKSANVSAIGNDLGFYARWKRGGGTPCVSWSGVGMVMRRNTLHDGPVEAVLGEGNVDCVFEENLVNHTTFEQTDMGAYYHGSGSGGYTYAWTQPGNVISNNTFMNIKFGERRPPEDEYMSTNAVYMDDVMAHYTIVNNRFIDVDVGVLVGGGLRHTVANNSFRACGTGNESACIHLDNRGMNWAHELCGCRCKFGRCSPGCHNGAALGPGLLPNLTADPDSFRFEQGVRLLRCIGPNAAPPCSTRADLQWLSTVLSDTTGGGSCAPAHNRFLHNTFEEGNVPWIICGDVHNASLYIKQCRKTNATDPKEVSIWGSVAQANTFVPAPLALSAATALVAVRQLSPANEQEAEAVAFNPQAEEVAALLEDATSSTAAPPAFTPTLAKGMPFPFTVNHEVETVHIVSSGHLDAGYTRPFVAQVLNLWFTSFIPRSIELSDRLRAKGGTVQHRWTMSPWIASMYVQCPRLAQWKLPFNLTTPLACPCAAELAKFKAAVARGDINLYASGFCTMYEYGDAELIRWMGDFAHSVGDLAGQPYRPTVASQRDEPGLTRAAIPHLAASGVKGLTLGMDWASPVPAVPPLFLWRDEPSNSELLVAWHNYGYGGGSSGDGFAPTLSGPNYCSSAPPPGVNCSSTFTLPGLKHALATFEQQDNDGPPTEAQLVHFHSLAKQMFPRAKVIASTYEAFFDELAKKKDALPVLTKEIGDTWTDTPPSDPLLSSQFRALLRVRHRCARDAPALCNGTDTSGAFYNFSRFLAKNIEHDWGYSRGAKFWSNDQLHSTLTQCATGAWPLEVADACNASMSYMDQRRWGVEFALDALRQTTPPHPLLEDANAELALLTPVRPDPQRLGLNLVARDVVAERFEVCGGALGVGIDHAGAINHLRLNRSDGDARVYADAEHLLAEPVVAVSSAAQRKAWAAAYMTDPAAGKLFFKTDDARGTGLGYRGKITQMWRGKDRLLVKLELPSTVVKDYGGAKELWQDYTFSCGVDGAAGGGAHINLSFSAFGKTSTRTTELWWMRFNPRATDATQPSQLRVEKLGAIIDPLDVAFNGSQTRHALSEGGIVYGGTVPSASAAEVVEGGKRKTTKAGVGGSRGSARFSSLDVPVVKLGAGASPLDGNASPLESLNPAPIPNDRPPNLRDGFAFNIYNNLWETNGIEWYPFELGERGTAEADWVFRFEMELP